MTKILYGRSGSNAIIQMYNPAKDETFVVLDSLPPPLLPSWKSNTPKIQIFLCCVIFETEKKKGCGDFDDSNDESSTPEQNNYNYNS